MDVNPVETFGKMDEKLTSDLFCPIWDWKESQNMGPGVHILHTFKSASSELKKKFHVNPVETFCKIDEKLSSDLILALLLSMVQKRTNVAPRVHSLHTPENTTDMPVNQVSWSLIKNCLRKWQKN